MSRIIAPSVLNGASLNKEQKERLQVMIDAVRKSDPSKRDQYVFDQAVKGFTKTAFASNGRWLDRQKFNLNNGDGPVVIPKWSSLLDGQ